MHLLRPDKMSDRALSQVILASADGAHITIDRAVADRSILLKNMIEDLGEDSVQNTPVPLPNVHCSVPVHLLSPC